jgi:hypothetical protein
MDEVDHVVNSETFEKLSEAAKNQVCRITLCGKHGLFEAMHVQNHVLRNRLTLMRLPPLAPAEVRALFMRPLVDLGFEIHDEDELLKQVQNDTGGYPHLVQYYGKRLVERALSQQVERIDLQLFIDVQNSYETLQTFSGPVLDIKSPQDELIALAILQTLTSPFTEHDVRQLGARMGVPIDEKGASRMCRRLYVNNVVSWLPASERYQVSNQALRRAVSKLGVLRHRFAELQKQFGRARNTGE